MNFEKYANKQNKEKMINITDNIIEVNLIHDNMNKENNTKVFGIDMILKTTLYFLKKTIYLITLIKWN